MRHLRPSMIVTLLFTLLASATLIVAARSESSAQAKKSWSFKYFAGDPPTWRDEPTSWSNKAECEIGRAEKTAAGYPVGDCYALPQVTRTPAAISPAVEPNTSGKVSPPPGSTTSSSSSSSTSSKSAASSASGDGTKGGSTTTTEDMERRRQLKLREGCLVQCNSTQRACLSALPDLQSCIQVQNSDCIESCTRVEQLPHHQCINEVCLPTEINIATWQGRCETNQAQAKRQCATAHASCEQACQ